MADRGSVIYVPSVTTRATWLLGLACMASSGSAFADVDAARVTKVLAAAGKPVVHPLAGDDGRIPLLVRVPPGVSAASLGLLEVSPGVGAIHLTPEALDSWAAAHPQLRATSAPRRKPLVDYSNKWHGAKLAREETGLDGSGVVVGIIDTGIDAAHPDFLDDSGQTRIAWLLNGQPPVGLFPQLEQKYGCNDPNQSPCAVFSGANINQLLLFNPDGAPRDLDGHGTHVSSLAAGNGGVSVDETPRFVGVAPKATLIIASPSAGTGFSDPDIINAARFIFEQAEEMGMPAVVNISLGSDFGPHDGTSLLEAGLAALVGDGHPGRALVVAAGNSGTVYPLDDAGPFGVHTEAHVSPNAVTRVPIQQPGATGTISGAGFVWVNFLPGDEVSVGLEGIGGDNWVNLVAPNDDAGYEGDGISAGVINNVVDDRSQLTDATNGAVVFWEGQWSGDEGKFAVLLQGRGDAQLWVTGTGGAAFGGRTLGMLFEKALKSGTISVPASHPDIIAVGCTLNRVSWRPYGTFSFLDLGSFGGDEPPIEDSVCYFSGAGPTPQGGMKPDILAPGAFVGGAISHDADPRINPNSIFHQPSCPAELAQPCGMLDESHALTSGTSMSSPMVAGAAALLLQLDPNLTQREVMEIIQAGARRPIGKVPYEYQQGVGALDVRGMIQAYDEAQSGASDADVTTSWFAVASPYLRPDPDWGVAGTVELRRADGTLASGVSAGRVRVRVDGGVVVAQPVKVRAGLFRFTVAAPFGSGGTEATVEVLYDGKSLGTRALPVGVDAWAALGRVKAVGACAFGRGAGDATWLALLFAALLIRRRHDVRSLGRARGNTTA